VVEERAAITIQRAWRRFVKWRKDEAARSLAEAAAAADAVVAAAAARRKVTDEALAAEAGAEAEAVTRAREAAEEAMIQSLRGVLWKCSGRFPRFLPRFMYVARRDEGGLAICYRSGDVDGSGEGELREIPLESLLKVAILDDLRYEFEVQSSGRRARYRFRVANAEQLEIWTNGLNALRGKEQVGGRLFPFPAQSVVL